MYRVRVCIGLLIGGRSVAVIHNASIMNAVGCCGMQLYRFGQTVSLTFLEEVCVLHNGCIGLSMNSRCFSSFFFFLKGSKVLPRSTYDKIAGNVNNGRLHTLCLLDIKMRERTVEVGLEFVLFLLLLFFFLSISCLPL